MVKERKPKLTLEEIKQRLIELDGALDRQHGKLGKKCETPEEEYKRLYANLKSREYKQRKRNMIDKEEQEFRDYYGIVEDEYGIRPKDERRYKACFKSAPIGSTVYRKYVKMMTGLTLKQIQIMQERTGLIPYPKVTTKEADADEKRRWELGEYL